jgi:hypothetical protein
VAAAAAALAAAAAWYVVNWQFQPSLRHTAAVAQQRAELSLTAWQGLCRHQMLLATVHANDIGLPTNTVCGVARNKHGTPSRGEDAPLVSLDGNIVGIDGMLYACHCSAVASYHT